MARRAAALSLYLDILKNCVSKKFTRQSHHLRYLILMTNNKGQIATSEYLDFVFLCWENVPLPPEKV